MAVSSIILIQVFLFYIFSHNLNNPSLSIGNIFHVLYSLMI